MSIKRMIDKVPGGMMIPLLIGAILRFARTDSAVGNSSTTYKETFE